jgi:hypothetical protein
MFARVSLPARRILAFSTRISGKGVQLQRIFVLNYIKQLLALIIRFCPVMSLLGDGISSVDPCLGFVVTVELMERKLTGQTCLLDSL